MVAGAPRTPEAPAVPAGAVLALRGVTKAFHTGRGRTVHALRGVDVEIFPGELVAVTGPSGSGKSTLLHILGLLERPTEGRVFVSGRELSRASHWELSRVRNGTIGFVFQLHHLLPHLTAWENAAVPLRYAGESRRAARAAAVRWLERVGLGDRLDHRPGELSGGERQRVAIARALANGPAVVLADEPTGELDSATTAEILDLIVRLNQEEGKAFVIVTHDPRVAERCTRRIALRDGRIVDEPAAAM